MKLNIEKQDKGRETIVKWNFPLDKPHWLKYLIINKKMDYDSGVERTESRIMHQSIEDKNKPEYLLCLSKYYDFVNNLAYAYKKEDIKKITQKIEEYYKQKLSSERLNEVKLAISLGSAGSFGGYWPLLKFPNKFRREYEFERFRNVFNNSKEFVKLNNLENLFYPAIKEEFQRELYLGDIGRFNLLNGEANFSSEGISKFILEDKKLREIATKDHYKMNLLQNFNCDMRLLLSAYQDLGELKDFDDRMFIGRNEENIKELNGFTIEDSINHFGDCVITEEYMQNEAKKLKNIMNNAIDNLKPIQREKYFKDCILP